MLQVSKTYAWPLARARVLIAQIGLRRGREACPRTGRWGCTGRQPALQGSQSWNSWRTSFQAFGHPRCPRTRLSRAAAELLGDREWADCTLASLELRRILMTKSSSVIVDAGRASDRVGSDRDVPSLTISFRHRDKRRGKKQSAVEYCGVRDPRQLQLRGWSAPAVRSFHCCAVRRRWFPFHAHVCQWASQGRVRRCRSLEVQARSVRQGFLLDASKWRLRSNAPSRCQLERPADAHAQGYRQAPGQHPEEDVKKERDEAPSLQLPRFDLRRRKW